MWPIIDILKVDPEFRTEKSAIRAIPESKELNEITEQLIDNLNLSKREIAKNFNVSKASIEAWCGHPNSEIHPVPLWILDRLVNLNGDSKELRMKINSLINKVRCGRTGNIHILPKLLTPPLAAFVGAHIADGSISTIGGSSSLNWELADGEKDNVEMCKKWIKEIFSIDLPVRKCKKARAWKLQTRIQIIPQFLIKIFDIPVGKKDEIVKEPPIIKMPENDKRLLTKPSLEEKRELELWFAKGVMNFDGHCTISGGTPTVCIGSNSVQLLLDLYRIFRENGVSFHLFLKHKKIMTTSKDESRKFLELGCFENAKQEKLKFLVKS
jgi:hypothetical protein